jgi:RimJ/RimL family protein N-acetyltransferase
VGRVPAELRTERLLLRQWREEDVEPLAEIYRQPEYLATMVALDLDETRAQVQSFARRWKTEGFSHWAAEERRSGRLIGRIGLLRHDDWPLWDSPVEVGWTLHRDWWGRGLATEGGRAAVESWRSHLDQPLLISITLPANDRSRGVMERLGMTRRGQVHWRGYDQVWYALERDEAGR